MKNYKLSGLSLIDIVIVFLSTGISWFNWDIIDILTVFIGPLVIGAWIIVFMVFFTIAVVKVIKTRTRQSITVVSMYAIVLIFHFFVSTTSNKIDVDFYLNFTRREKVISDLNSGMTFTSAQYNPKLQKLPAKYYGLSKGGNEIVVDENSVLFFTFRGILDNFSGFVYMKNGKVPPDDFGGSTIIDKINYKDNWWWVSAH